MAEEEFDRLLKTIEKTERQIGTLQRRIETLQKQLASGDWGTGQLDAFRTELSRVTSLLASTKATQISLINKKDVAESTAELRRLNEAVTKNVDSIKKKLGELRSSRGAAETQYAGFPIEKQRALLNIDRQIADAEKELARVRSLGARATRRPFESVNLSQRLGAAPAPATPEDLIGNRLGELPPKSDLTSLHSARVRRIAREAAEKVINQIQNELLQGAIEARSKPISPGLVSQVNRVIEETAADRDARRIAERAERIRALAAEFPSLQDNPAVSTINHPVLTPEQVEAKSRAEFEAQKKRWEEEDKIRRQAQAQAEADYRRSPNYRRERFIDLKPERAEQPAPFPLPNTEDGKVFDEELGRTLSQREVIEREALGEAKKLIAAERKYAHALEVAAQQGFSPDNLKRVRTRGTGGIEQLQFQRTDDYGRQRNLDLFVNQAGKATAGISNQFRTFGQGIVRDIGELTKWSIALAAVYGPLKKLQELTQIMIENQTRLAEAVTSVSSAFIGQDEIFNAAADAANAAGEAVEGVIDAFTLAYRAAGAGSSEVERFATANDLLANALILSKLSSLDQATAIDTLAAALRQTNGDLEGGRELLDSWVRVTKVANVDLASLATGFAVLGDSAEAAGLDADQLNGVLAAIGETGVASGRELANTARAIVSGFQSDQAREALENIGVAVEDTTGKARPFLEVMTEISNLRLSGALDDTAFSKLTLALGGGTRRQAAYATFIENLGRVNEVAAESAKANGDAQAALARQLETVQTSLARLNNAFSELAQSMGTEGGFLGIITKMVDLTTGLVKIFDGLVSVLGKATPAMLAFVAASVALRYKGYGGITGGVQSLSQRIDITPQREEENSSFERLGYQVPLGDRFRSGVSKNLLGTNVSSGAFQGLLAAALPALLNATNKEDRFGGTKAGANLIGGIGGGILGALAGPQGIAAGAILGTAISEAFVNSTIARKTDIFGYQAPSLTPAGPGGASTTKELDDALVEAEAGLYKSIGFGSEGLGRLLTAGTTQVADNLMKEINEAIANQDPEGIKKALNKSTNLTGINSQRLLESIGITPQLLDTAVKSGRQIDFKKEYVAFSQASPEAQSVFREAEAARAAKGGTPLDQSTQFSKLIEANTKAFSPLLDRIQSASKAELNAQRVAGDVRGAEYGRRTEAISGSDTKALQYYTALGNEVDRLDGEANDAAKAFDVLNNIIVFGAEDSLPQITSLTSEIETLINLLADPILHEDEILKLGGIDAAKLDLQTRQEDLATLIEDANKQALLSQIKLPTIQGDLNRPLTGQEEALVEQRTSQLDNSYYKDYLNLPDDMNQAIHESFDDFAVPIKDFEDAVLGFKTITETDAQLRQAAIAQLMEEGRLPSQQTNPFGIQQLDITSQQGAGLQGSIDYFSQYLAQNFPQYEQKPEDVGVIFSDYVTDVLHGDNLAIKLALEKIVDLNQKQLDGMYNIPEGATFWVPLTAAYYRPENNGGGAGMPAVDAAAVDGNTSATEMNTQALRDATDKWMNADPYLYDRDKARGQATGTEGNLSRGQEADAVRLQAQADRYNTDRGRIADAARYTGLASLYGNKSEEPKPEGFLQQLQSWFRSIFSNPQPPLSGRPNMRADTVGDAAGGYRGFTSQAAAQQINPQVSARLEIQMDNTTQLIVDGRVLAAVMSPYMAQEMIRLEATQGTITKRYVI
jgi:TP901 family phage tail tape measure protein